MDEHIIPRNPDGTPIHLGPTPAPVVPRGEVDPSRALGFAVVLGLSGGVAGYLVQHEKGAAIGALLGAIIGIAYANFSTP